MREKKVQLARHVIFLVATTVLFCQTNSLSAQVYGVYNIRFKTPEISLLGIEKRGEIHLKTRMPRDAGTFLRGSSPKRPPYHAFLNLTSSVKEGETRRVSVKIDRQIPGARLKLKLERPVGAQGLLGTIAGKNASFILSSTVDQTIIEGIGDAYTGVGIGKGYRLYYVLNISRNRYNRARASSGSVVVRYTLSD